MGDPTRTRERLYELIVESTSEGVWVIDADSITTYVNQSMADMLGYTRDELIGRSMFDLMDDEGRRIAARNVERRKAGISEAHEFVFRRKDGSPLFTRLTTNVLREGEDGRYAGALALVIDLTRERAMAQELEMTEARCRALIENSLDLLLLADATGRFTFASPSVERILGYTPRELVASDPVELIHPDDRAIALGALASAKAGDTTARIDLRVRHRNGDWITLSADGRNMLDNPAVRAFVLNARDVTSERELEEQLEQSQRLESIGRLAGGIAHDFNNILTTILSSVAFLEENTALSASDLEDLREIGKAGERATELTSQLLAFARRRFIRPKSIDLGTVLAGQERFLQRVLGEEIELRTRVAESLWPVLVDPSQLEQVILNLAVNARDAMPRGGRLTFEAQNVVVDESFATHHAEVTPGPYVLLAVSDTGEGIAKDVLPHIFEPFYTTKPVGAGTGLGLATVYGIVRQGGGHIWVYSEPSVGTTFKLYFPRSSQATEAIVEPARPETTRGNERVLVVEDDEIVRRMVVRALSGAGYVVHAEPTPEAGIAWARAQNGDLDLLVTDVVMPGMSGKELAARLEADLPKLRVLFVSGYTEDTIVHRGVLDPDVELLAKPFSPAQLRARVRALLDRV
jgi:PAS domain S-box-containing protein